MRINQKPTIARLSKSTKSRGAKSSGGNFQAKIGRTDSVVAGIGPIAGTGAVSGIEALLAVQQVEESSAQIERDWVKHWGGDVLSRLSQIHEGLLSGTIPLERLNGLTEALDSRGGITDPELKQLVDEIELRGRIEIAKLQRDQG